MTFLHLACALTTATDGSEDDCITCFKPGGMIGTCGLATLKGLRAEEQALDGRYDDEEAGLSDDDDEAVLQDVGDDEDLLFY